MNIILIKPNNSFEKALIWAKDNFTNYHLCEFLGETSINNTKLLAFKTIYNDIDYISESIGIDGTYIKF